MHESRLTNTGVSAGSDIKLDVYRSFQLTPFQTIDIQTAIGQEIFITASFQTICKCGQCGADWLTIITGGHQSWWRQSRHSEIPFRSLTSLIVVFVAIDRKPIGSDANRLVMNISMNKWWPRSPITGDSFDRTQNTGISHRDLHKREFQKL